jgi:hypothetical protein
VARDRSEADVEIIGAIRMAMPLCVRLLIEHGADKNAALEEAVDIESAQMTQLLLQLGANPFHKQEGRSIDLLEWVRRSIQGVEKGIAAKIDQMPGRLERLQEMAGLLHAAREAAEFERDIRKP